MSELVNQVSKTSVSAVNPPGLPRWDSSKPGGRRGHGIDRQKIFRRQNRVFEIRRAAGGDRIPERERHAEVALAADAPIHVQVFSPAPVAASHELGVPLDAVAHFEQTFLLVEQADEPLARGDELERLVAFLVELHGVFDRLGLLDERRAAFGRRGGGIAQEFDHSALGLLDIAAGERRVGTVGGGGIVAGPAVFTEFDGQETAVASDSLT